MYGVKTLNTNILTFNIFYKCNKYYSEAVCYIAWDQPGVVIISRKFTESVVHNLNLESGVDLPNFKHTCYHKT